MDSPTSSPGIIPKKTLKIWKVFNDLRPEGGEILKSAKLAHVHEKEGIVVTMEDETYHFLRDDKHAARTTRVRELCGVRVKGVQNNYKLKIDMIRTCLYRITQRRHFATQLSDVCDKVKFT